MSRETRKIYDRVGRYVGRIEEKDGTAKAYDRVGRYLGRESDGKLHDRVGRFLGRKMTGDWLFGKQ